MAGLQPWRRPGHLDGCLDAGAGHLDGGPGPARHGAGRAAVRDCSCQAPHRARVWSARLCQRAPDGPCSSRSARRAAPAFTVISIRATSGWPSAMAWRSRTRWRAARSPVSARTNSSLGKAGYRCCQAGSTLCEYETRCAAGGPGPGGARGSGRSRSAWRRASRWPWCRGRPRRTPGAACGPVLWPRRAAARRGWLLRLGPRRSGGRPRAGSPAARTRPPRAIRWRSPTLLATSRLF